MKTELHQVVGASHPHESAALHVSGDDSNALELAIAPYRREPYTWVKIPSGLEDIFIHLMDSSQDNFKP